jgi:hypothetical protein
MMHRETETPRGIEAVQSQLDALKKRTAALETAHAKCEARIRDLHDQNTSLVQLTVASQLLANSIEREDVLCAIEEVVVNMIGSEELAIFDLEGEEQLLKIARVRGMEPTSPRLLRAFGPIRCAIRSGQTLITREARAGAGDADGGLTAAIPLKVERNVTGLVAIFRLLEQKAGLDPTDHELFEVLSRQAAMALYSTAFRSLRPTARPPRKST